MAGEAWHDGEMATRQTLESAPRQILAVLAVGIVLLGGLAYALAPFKAAGGLKCKAALLGSQPKERVTQGLLVGREKPVCRSKGNSRLFIAGFATVAAMAVVLSAVFLPVGPLEELFVRQE